MSEDIKFGLNDLVVGDDLNISLDNETYQDQTRGFAPPATGIYVMRTLELDAARYRSGENKGQPVYKQGYPVLELRMVEIVEGLGDGVTRKVGLFQEISTKPTDRKGTSASQVGDFARAYGLANFTAAEMVARLKEAVEGQLHFGAKLDWRSQYDSALVKAANEQLGIPSDYDARDEEQRKLANLIQYRLSRVEGMKNFPFNAKTGRFEHTILRGNVTFEHPISKAQVTIECEPRSLEAQPWIPVYFGNMAFIPKADIESGKEKVGPFRIAVPAAA
jgi:hypothetical protein